MEYTLKVMGRSKEEWVALVAHYYASLPGYELCSLEGAENYAADLFPSNLTAEQCFELPITLATYHRAREFVTKEIIRRRREFAGLH